MKVKLEDDLVELAEGMSYSELEELIIVFKKGYTNRTYLEDIIGSLHHS